METLKDHNAICDEWVRKVEFVEITAQEFSRLLEYSSSLPTGKTLGKQWKRQLYFGSEDVRLSWVLCEYVEDPDPKFVAISNKRIKITPPTEEDLDYAYRYNKAFDVYVRAIDKDEKGSNGTSDRRIRGSREDSGTTSSVEESAVGRGC